MNTDHFIALYDMENYIWTMIMASWTPLIIHDSYELQTSMISDHSKWGFIRFTRSMITHDCYEHWLWAITVHRNSYEFGFWTINDQTHHTWWGGINAMKCWCSYMINTDSVSYYDPYSSRIHSDTVFVKVNQTANTGTAMLSISIPRMLNIMVFSLLIKRLLFAFQWDR